MKKEDEYKMIEQQIEKKKRIKKYINVVHGVKSNLHGLNFGNIMIIVRGKRKNSISQIDIRRNQKYIKNGKMYTISDIEHVFRRNKHRSSQVNSIIVRLYCDEDQTSIRHAFSCDRRFKLDENNHIIIE